jgi:predicted nucleic acid-binding protein
MGAASVVVDASFLIALWCRRDEHHAWAIEVAQRYPPVWTSCESALSEADHLIGSQGAARLREACRRGAIRIHPLGDDFLRVLDLMDRFADTPMSVADACLVRLTELLDNPLLLTVDANFRVYRRSGRRRVPVRMPP